MKDIARFRIQDNGLCLTIEENMAIAKNGEQTGLSWGLKKKTDEEFKTALAEPNIGLENRCLKWMAAHLSGGQRKL